MIQNITKGQSMFELLVAVSISSLILIGLISLTTSSVKNSSGSRDNSQASRYAQEAMEFIREARDAEVELTNWNSFVTKFSSDTGKNYCMNTSPPGWTMEGSSCGTGDTIGSTIYRRDVTLTTRDGVVAGDENAVDVSVVVSWDTSQGENYATISSTLTNWMK